jgi:hypothetical protein
MRIQEMNQMAAKTKPVAGPKAAKLKTAAELLEVVYQQLAEAQKADDHTIHTIVLTPDGEVVTVSEVWSDTDRDGDGGLWKRLYAKVKTLCSGQYNEIVSVTGNEFLIGSKDYDEVDDDILLESLGQAMAVQAATAAAVQAAGK